MRSLKGPTVIFPPFLASGKGSEFLFARKSYFLVQMKKYLIRYEANLVKARAKHLAKLAANPQGLPTKT